MDLPVVVLAFVLSPVNVTIANDLRVLCAIRTSVAAAAGVRSQDIFISGFFEIRTGTRTRFNDTEALDVMCSERRRRLASTGRSLGDTITALPNIVGGRVDSSSRATTVTTGFVVGSTAQAATAASALKDSVGSGAMDSVTVALETVTGDPAGSFAADVDANSVKVTTVSATRASFYFVLDIVRRNFYQLIGSVSFVVLYLLLAASCKTPVWKRCPCFKKPAPVDKRAALRTKLRRANARQRMRIFIIIVRFVGRLRWAVARGLEEEWREMHRDANTESVMLSSNASPTRARRPHVPMARRPSWPLYRPPSRTAEDELELNYEDDAALNVDAAVTLVEVLPAENDAPHSARHHRMKRSPQQQHQRELARQRARNRIRALRSLLLFVVRVSLFSRWRREEPSRVEDQVAPSPYEIPEKWLIKEAQKLAARHAASAALAASLKETDRAVKKNLTKKLLLQLHRLVGSRDTSAEVMGVIEAALTSVEAPSVPTKAPLPHFPVKHAPKNPLLEEAAALRKSAISPGALAGASALFGVRPSGLLARAHKTSTRGAVKSPIALVRHADGAPPAAELKDRSPSTTSGEVLGDSLDVLTAAQNTQLPVLSEEHAPSDSRPSSVYDMQNEVTRTPEDAGLPRSPYSQHVPRVTARGVRPRIDPNEWALKRAASIARAAERKSGARDWNDWDQTAASVEASEHSSPVTSEHESLTGVVAPQPRSATPDFDFAVVATGVESDAIAIHDEASITVSAAEEPVTIHDEASITVSAAADPVTDVATHDAVPKTPTAAGISRAFEDALDVFSAAQTTKHYTARKAYPIPTELVPRNDALRDTISPTPSSISPGAEMKVGLSAAHGSTQSFTSSPHPPPSFSHTEDKVDEIHATSSETSNLCRDSDEVPAVPPSTHHKPIVLDKAERLRASRLERKEEEAKAAVFAKRVETIAAALQSPEHDDAVPISPAALREQALAGRHGLLLPSAIPRPPIALPSIHDDDNRTPPRTPLTTGIPAPVRGSAHSTPRRSKR